MSHPYLPQTEVDTKQMLKAAGLESTDDLFSSIPGELRASAKRMNAVGDPLSEQEVVSEMSRLASLNADDTRCDSFLGGGCYRHFVPSVIDQMVLRGEFLTSYTPYQPEVSQGTLQSIFEFQSLVVELTGLDVSNAGLYDGANSLVEAALLALRLRKGRSIVLISEAISPRVRGCLETIVRGVPGIEIVPVPWDPKSGQTSIRAVEEKISLHGDKVAALILGYPNYLGVFDELPAAKDILARTQSLLISYTAEALALGVVASPGSLGADIAVGDMQSFGASPSFGGPWCGFMGTRQEFVRQMPGKVAGQTVDRKGRRGFVLTLATREQHIRREKATSNICSNQALLSLCANAYLSLLGPTGLRELADVNFSRRVYLENKLEELGLRVAFSGPRFNEFVLDVSTIIASGVSCEELLQRLFREDGILLGPALSSLYPDQTNKVLVSTTELNSRQSLDRLVEALASKLK